MGEIIVDGIILALAFERLSIYTQETSAANSSGIRLLGIIDWRRSEVLAVPGCGNQVNLDTNY